MKKTLTILLIALIWSVSLKAADFTVAIEQPVGPLGQWYLDYKYREHLKLLKTHEALALAREIQARREDFRNEKDSHMRNWISTDIKMKEKELVLLLEKLNEDPKVKRARERRGLSLKAAESDLKQALGELNQPKQIEIRRAIPATARGQHSTK